MKFEKVNIGLLIEQKMNELDINKSEMARRSGIANQNINGGVAVAGNGKEETAEKYQNVSRIKFTIPALLPHASSLDQEVVVKDGAGHRGITRREFQNTNDQ